MLFVLKRLNIVKHHSLAAISDDCHVCDTQVRYICLLPCRTVRMWGAIPSDNDQTWDVCLQHAETPEAFGVTLASYSSCLEAAEAMTDWHHV